MCNFTNTKFTCGCVVEENTSVCGWVNDDMAECMNNYNSVDVLVARNCGKQVCKDKELALRPKTLDSGLERLSSSSGDEWAAESVTSSEL